LNSQPLRKAFYEETSGFSKCDIYVFTNCQNMDNSEKLYQERKKILKEFFETKARLEEVTLENNSLKSQNELLEDRLAEREEEMQNLFSFIHTGA